MRFTKSGFGLTVKLNVLSGDGQLVVFRWFSNSQNSWCLELTLCWVFLSNRSQKEYVNRSNSESAPVTSSISQGSVLGPLLCHLYQWRPNEQTYFMNIEDSYQKHSLAKTTVGKKLSFKQHIIQVTSKTNKNLNNIRHIFDTFLFGKAQATLLSGIPLDCKNSE